MVESSNENVCLQVNFTFYYFIIYFFFIRLLSWHNIFSTKWIYIKCARIWMGIWYRVYYYPITDIESNKFTEFRDHHHKLFHLSKISTKQWMKSRRCQNRKEKDKKYWNSVFCIRNDSNVHFFFHIFLHITKTNQLIQRTENENFFFGNLKRCKVRWHLWKIIRTMDVFSSHFSYNIFSFINMNSICIHENLSYALCHTEWYPWNIWLPFVKMICENIPKYFILV